MFEKIGEDEPFPLDDLSAYDFDRAAEHGARNHTGVELATLSTGVHAGG